MFREGGDVSGTLLFHVGDTFGQLRLFASHMVAVPDVKLGDFIQFAVGQPQFLFSQSGILGIHSGQNPFHDGFGL